MRLVSAVVVAAIISTDALAEVGIEHAVKAVPFAAEPEPLLPERCEFLQIRNGVKFWRGDCVSASPYATDVTPKKKSWSQKSRLVGARSGSGSARTTPHLLRSSRYSNGR
jgi:hypothetical protein